MVSNLRDIGAARLVMKVDEAVTELQKVGVINCQTLEEAIDTVIKISKD